VQRSPVRFLALSLCACTALLAFGVVSDDDHPEPKNPVKSVAKSLSAGKKLYEGNCLACHGEKGKGDGPMAIILPKKPTDLSDPVMFEESDADVFKTITRGRRAMPKFKALLSDEERRNVVNYLRTLAPKPNK